MSDGYEYCDYNGCDEVTMGSTGFGGGPAWRYWVRWGWLKLCEHHWEKDGGDELRRKAK